MPHQRRAGLQVVEPMGVILYLIETVSGALVFTVLIAARGEGAKVLQQCPAAQPTLRRMLVAVKSAAGVQKSGQSVHQTIGQITGAVAARMRVAHRILVRPVPQFGDDVHDGFAPGPRCEPDPERGPPRVKLVGRAGAVHLPDLLVQFSGLAAAVANLKKPVQEAQNHGDCREQSPKGVLRCEPAVGVHRSWSVFGVHVFAFRLKCPLGHREMLLVGRFGQPHSQRASAAGRERHVALFAAPIGVVLVRDEVLRQPRRVADRGADEAVAAQPFQKPLPEHVVVAEDLRDDPAGGADREQQQGVFEFPDGARQITEDKARPQGKSAAVAEFQLPQPDAGHFLRLRMKPRQLKSRVNSIGKQFGGLLHQLLDGPSDLDGIVPDAIVRLPCHRNHDLPGSAGRPIALGLRLPGTRPGL